MGRKLTREEYENLLPYMFYGAGNSKYANLYVLAEALSVFLYLLNVDIEITDDRPVHDLYLEMKNGEVWIKGKIPSSYDKTEMFRSIVMTLLMYMNLQFLRGRDKNTVAWISSVYKFYKDVFDIPVITDIEENFHEPFHVFIENTRDKIQDYTFTEEDNYEILKKILPPSQSPSSGRDDGISSDNGVKAKGSRNNVRNDIKDKFKQEQYVPTTWKKKIIENFAEAEKISNSIQISMRNNFEGIRGKLPGNAVEYLKKILKIELPWDEILKRKLNLLFEKTESRRWNWLNIYYRHIRYLPSPDTEEAIFNITCFIDTSGSMTTEELRRVFGVVYDLVEKNNIKYVTIVQHDYNMQDVVVISSDEIVDENTFIEYVGKIKGRGGTSHVEPYKEYMKEIEIKDLPPPEFIIFLSDFYSDFEDLVSKLKKDDIDFFCITTERVPKGVKNVMKIR